MWAGMFGSAYSVATFPILPVITRCSKQFGKKYTLIAGALISAGASLASLILFSPQHPWLVVVSGFLIAPAGTCIWILLWSMIADCCDAGELASGVRQEGLYGVLYVFVTKLCTAGVTVLTGVLLVYSGFEASVAPSEAVILRLRLMYALIPAILLISAAALVVFFPLTEARLRAIRAELDERRKQTPVTT